MKKIIIALVLLVFFAGCNEQAGITNYHALYDDATAINQELTLQNKELITQLNLYENKTSELQKKLDEALGCKYNDFLKELDYIDDLNANITSTDTNKISITFNRPVYLVKKGNYLWMTCDTHSMTPTFNCKKTLIAYVPKKEEIKTGDIIMFKNNEYKQRTETYENYSITYNKGKNYEYLIHRIIAIEGDWLTTKGDNNEYAEANKTNINLVSFKIWQ